jgi:RNA polymerase sigma factor for flagellar operon FliA
MNKFEHVAGTPQAKLPDLELYMRLVHRTAVRIRLELGLHDVVELDDLKQYGMLGLLKAANGFDASKGTEFRFYAHSWIRGAIYDGLRAMTRLPRRAHQRLEAARRQAETDGTDISFDGPSDRILSSVRLIAQGYLIARTPFPDCEPAPEIPSPEELAGTNQLAARVRAAVAELPDPDREVVERHYYSNQPLPDIARELGIDRTWAWRVHARALRNISLRLKGEENRPE